MARVLSHPGVKDSWRIHHTSHRFW